MDIHLHGTGYGGADTRLREVVADAKADDPLAPVTVVVPTNIVGVSVRRMLAGGGPGRSGPGRGIAGLTVLTVWRLAELLGAPRLAADGRRPASTPVITAALRRVLAHEPGMFAEVAEHPATEEALVRVHRELSDCSPVSLDTLAEAGGRVADVVRIHRAVREVLADGWYEEADLMAAATDAAAGGAGVAGELGTVVLHLPQRLSPDAAALVRTLAGATPVHVIAGLTGAQDADEDVRRSLERLGLDGDLGAPAAPPVATRVISTSDADEEVRSAVDELMDAARRGVPLARTALVYPHREPYARIVHEQLAAAGLDYNGAAVRPLAERVAGRWLLDVLELPRRDLARPAVMNVLGGAPVTDTDGRRVPLGAWERVSREAGVVRGRDDWTDGLKRHAERLRGEAEQLRQAEGRGWLADRKERQAGVAEDLQAFVTRLIGRLDGAHELTSWDELSDWCDRMLADHLAGWPDTERWPEDERDAANRVGAALDRLAGLDAIEPDTDLARFRRTLELELDQDLDRVGRVGEGVMVGPPSTALGVDLDVVIVLGMAEGVFPTRPREDSLVGDHDRRRVADELPPRTARVGVEHRHLLAALATAGERVLIHPRGDLRRSTEHAPSRWLLDTCEGLGGDRALPDDGAAWFEEVPSYAGRRANDPFPSTPRAWRLRSLEDARRAGRRAGQHPLADGDPAFAAGVELEAGRRSRDFTRFDGNLAGLEDLAELVRSPAGGHTTSPSRLERWVGCPHAYLANHVLGIEPIEPPEEIVSISPLDRGALIHDVLDRWLSEQLQNGPPAPGEPWSPRARRRLRQIAEQRCDVVEQQGLTGHRLLWQRDRRRILHELDRFADEDDQRRAELGLTPEATEVAFGLFGDAPVEVALGDGRTIPVRGKIDRLDERGDGAPVVTDYKTGSTRRYKELDEDELARGRYLQLPLYALAAADRAGHDGPVRADYWFTSEKRDFRSTGFEVDGAVVGRLREVLRTLVDHIEAGVFPQRPAEPGWKLYVECRYCDPDELGTADRHRRWERLRLHPDLRELLRMIEPEIAAELDGPEAS